MDHPFLTEEESADAACVAAHGERPDAWCATCGRDRDGAVYGVALPPATGAELCGSGAHVANTCACDGVPAAEGAAVEPWYDRVEDPVTGEPIPTATANHAEPVAPGCDRFGQPLVCQGCWLPRDTECECDAGGPPVVEPAQTWFCGHCGGDHGDVPCPVLVEEAEAMAARVAAAKATLAARIAAEVAAAKAAREEPCSECWRLACEAMGPDDDPGPCGLHR